MPMPRRNAPAAFSNEWWESKTTAGPNGCLLWKGFQDTNGYCRTWKDGKPGVLVHRAAYECFRGPVDPSLKVCHSCDVPNCVNPYHLFLGTQRDNLRDMFRKGRAKPRGRAVAGLTKKRQHAVSPTLALPGLASESSNASVRMVSNVHLIGTKQTPKDVVAPWRTVIGVPPVQPTQAVVLWKRPLEWTGNRQPASNLSRGWLDAAQPCRIGGRES